jgi:hypothetical protein
MDSQTIRMNEVAHRITLKPYRWLRPSFRYQMQLYDYETGIENLVPVETDMTSHIFSFDLSVQPCAKLLFLTSLSRQNMSVHTPAVSAASGRTPRFNADVTSWFFNANYLLNEKITLTEGFEFSIADNFDDFTSEGLPQGTDYHEIGLTSGVRWQITEHMAVEPKYGLYLYRTNSLTDTGNYTAHILWLRTVFNWD